METIKLSNGVEMPQVGYGVYQVEPEECEALVVDAINVGYRMIDTAQAYLNEEAVGSAWRKSGISRDDLFLVSKVWPSNYGEGQTMKASTRVCASCRRTISTSCFFTSLTATAMEPIVTWRRPTRPASSVPSA